MPGGVNSPVRAFRAVEGEPLLISRARGSRMFDVDGNEYIDYVGSWGPMIIGHAHPRVVDALQKAVERGTSFGASTELEIILAKMVVEAVPSIEMVRMVNSGTEATMSAIRLARAYTGRDKVVKFAGCYHGHADGLLVRAGSGATTLGVPDSPGVPEDYAGQTLTARFNDIESVNEIFKNYEDQVAAVILEPVAGNMGVIPPKDGFLESLREITRASGALLIFDEVMSGFRVAYGGAQARYGVNPDLTCLGKVIGGGLPVGAYGGKKKIMNRIAPEGPVYQAGTLSGNPLAMTAGIETLEILKEKGVYEQLDASTREIADALEERAKKKGIPVQVSEVTGMFSLFFTENPVTDYDQVMKCDTKRFSSYFKGMLQQGIYLPPSQFEAVFVSLAHTRDDIQLTVDAVDKVFEKL